MYETVAEFGSIVIRAVGAFCAAAAGVFIEINGIQTLGTGEQVIGLWMALFGCLLLIVGYVLVGDALRLLRQPAR